MPQLLLARVFRSCGDGRTHARTSGDQLLRQGSDTAACARCRGRQAQLNNLTSCKRQVWSCVVWTRSKTSLGHGRPVREHLRMGIVRKNELRIVGALSAVQMIMTYTAPRDRSYCNLRQICCAAWVGNRSWRIPTTHPGDDLCPKFKQERTPQHRRASEMTVWYALKFGTRLA